MSNDRIGKTIIDELRLCYIAEPAFLTSLSTLNFGERLELGQYTIVRIIAQHFEYYFNLIDNGHLVGYVYYGRYGDISNYLWVKVDNRLLYDDNGLRQLILDIQSLLPITFNNITKIDLAKDFKKNICYTINRYIRNKNIKTIINGKVLKDRKAKVKGLKYTYDANLDRVLHPTISLCQAKAEHNKSKGVAIQGYNKMEEIASSGKEYILAYYGYPKTLHRLEVRLNSGEISDYYKIIKKYQSPEDIFNNDFLSKMYDYHLGSVLRFTQGRTPIPWSDIMH
ncbi:MAG: hypothetical protein IJE99_03775 [Alistipes sp.]|nr:hypothetical protein [Alistipes sp.]